MEAPFSVVILLLAAAAIGITVVLSYSVVRGKSSKRDRWVLGTVRVANIIIWESGLSFLGMGVPPPMPTWGRMLAEGRVYITDAWWLVTLPGLAIMLTILSINLLGDGLRDALDPRIRNIPR